MNTNELNEYLENYLKNDVSRRAIMLTADWGSGKTFYIKNDLMKKLKNKCVYVSLYGIKNLEELNKELYLEIKLKKSQHPQLSKAKKYVEAFGSTVVGIGKTIIKKLCHVDLNVDWEKPNIEKLYEEVNLKNKLIIFDDLERSKIDLIEFLGYINNLEEHDGIKVLLVANEREILKYDEREKNNETISIPNEATLKYLKIKEKTISDTIQFYGNTYNIIQNIYNEFKNNYFTKINDGGYCCSKFNIIEKIASIMQELKCNNYRLLLFGLQKTYDIFIKLDITQNYDLEFLEHIMLGAVAFAMNNKLTEDLVWKEISYTSSTLGCARYPLDKFVFDYIRYQKFKTSDVDFAQDLFLKGKELAEADRYLYILYNYHISSETNVKEAINHIYSFLNDNKLLISEYVRIANYLVSLIPIIGCEKKIDACLDCMLKNAKAAVKSGENIKFYSSSFIIIDTESYQNKFNDFKTKLTNIINKKENIFNFDYTVKNLDQFCDEILRYANKATYKNGFARQLNINKFLQLIKQCSSLNICNLRDVFLTVYRYSNINQFYYDDKENLIKLKDGLQKIIDVNGDMDAIKKKQMQWFINDLQTAIETLIGG